MPVRIQRKRTKGWKASAGAVYVGRPTIFGNPFKVDKDHGPDWAVAMFKRWINGEAGTGGGGIRRMALLARISELRGKDLMCFCHLDHPCHANILLEISNQ